MSTGMSREAQLELARRQQSYQWKRTKKALQDFAKMCRKHDPEVGDEAQNIADRFDMVADLENITDAKPEDFGR